MSSLLRTLVSHSFVPKSLSPSCLRPAVKTSVRLEEQIVPGYRPDRFFPMQLWKTYNDHYRVFAKLGFGDMSTVWLARDTRKPWWARSRYAALKILVNDVVSWDTAHREYAVSRRIASADPDLTSDGAWFLCPAYDAFEIDGPRGQHPCLVYEPMGCTLASWKRVGCRLVLHPLPPDAVKQLLRLLLCALDYLHTRCGVIHTDLKRENLFFPIGLWSMNVLDDLARQEAEDPFPRISDGDYTVYISRTITDSENLSVPKLGDFSHAVIHDECPRNYSIQPDPFRAPEVILGIPWSYSADIWNLGMLAWELSEIGPLLRGLDPKKQCYTQEFHLGEMMALLGRPPSNLLHRGGNTTTYFSPTGAFRGAILERQTLESRMHYTPDEDRAGFASFLEKALQWQPEDRPSAAELLRDPWVQSGVHFYY